MAKKVSIKVIKLPKPNAKLNMSIMHPLNKDTLTKQVLKAKVGNYALGIRIQKNNRFIFKPLYVGRSDTDLNKEIQQQGLTLKVDANRKPLHTHFKYSYAPDIMAAFLKECNNFQNLNLSKSTEIDFLKKEISELKERFDKEFEIIDRKSTRLNSSHSIASRMPSSA